MARTKKTVIAGRDTLPSPGFWEVVWEGRRAPSVVEVRDDRVYWPGDESYTELADMPSARWVRQFRLKEYLVTHAKKKTAKKKTAKKRTAKKRTAKKRTAKKRTAKKRTAKKRTAKKRTAKKRTAKKRTNPEGRRYEAVEYRQWFLDAAAESEGFEGEVEITSKLDQKWDEFEEALDNALVEWVLESELSDEKLEELRDGDPELNVFSTLTGEGVGIWDGRWDHILTEAQIEDLTKYLKRKLGKYADDTGGGSLEDLMRDAVGEARVAEDAEDAEESLDNPAKASRKRGSSRRTSPELAAEQRAEGFRKATKAARKKPARKKAAAPTRSSALEEMKTSKKPARKKKKRKAKAAPLAIAERTGRVTKRSKAACVIGASSYGRPTRSEVRALCGEDAPPFREAADRFSRMGVLARQSNPEEERMENPHRNPEHQQALARRLVNP